MFVTSPGLDSRSILEFVIKEDVVVIPGALTPTEVSTAWQAGADFVKVFPCHSMGGPRYIRALRATVSGDSDGRLRRRQSGQRRRLHRERGGRPWHRHGAHSAGKPSNSETPAGLRSWRSGSSASSGCPCGASLIRAPTSGICCSTLAAIGVVTKVYVSWLHVTNDTTAALSFLLLILFAAASSRLWVALVASAVAALAYDFFFLPPTGDPQHRRPSGLDRVLFICRGQRRGQSAVRRWPAAGIGRRCGCSKSASRSRSRSEASS